MSFWLKKIHTRLFLRLDVLSWTVEERLEAEMPCANSSSFQGLELWVIFFIVRFKKESKILFLVKDEKVQKRGEYVKEQKRKEEKDQMRGQGVKR